MTTTSIYAASPVLKKGDYFVKHISLYYVLDARPIEGLLLIENCWTDHVQWEKANIVRNHVKEVIKTT
jgi:hypothetical protein